MRLKMSSAKWRPFCCGDVPITERIYGAGEIWLILDIYEFYGNNFLHVLSNAYNLQEANDVCRQHSVGPDNQAGKFRPFENLIYAMQATDVIEDYVGAIVN